VQALVTSEGTHPVSGGATRAWQTSLAQSSRGHGAQLRRLALGGVARRGPKSAGHRRTYIGRCRQEHPVAQEGRKRQSGVLLDEVDKMSTDFRGRSLGGPAEVGSRTETKPSATTISTSLHLSDVMFITTANYLQGIPVPLAGSHGSDPDRRLHRNTKSWPSPSSTWSQTSSADPRPGGHHAGLPEETSSRPHPRLHQGGWCAQPGNERSRAFVARSRGKYLADRSVTGVKITPKRVAT